MSWLFQSPLATAAFGGAVTLLLRSLLIAIFSDIARRIAWTLIGMRIFDFVLGWATRHAIWSGRWEIAWHVTSENFAPENVDVVRIYRVFNRIGFQVVTKNGDGKSVPYGFVGDLSRDKSIVTGLWFDGRGSAIGYHGAYQLRLKGDGYQADGVWIGFSETSSAIKHGKLIWKKQH